jgi:hypothetical protein
MPMSESDLLDFPLHEARIEDAQFTEAFDFSATLIPRSALLRAIRSHNRLYALAEPGEAFETRHSHEGTLFHVRTDAAQTETVIRLDGES